jgi:polyadenylate-binding protein
MPTLLILDRLPGHLSEEQLVELLGPFGPVLSTRVVKNSRGHSLHFAVVEMQREEDAYRAVSALNGNPIDGQVITVSLT